MCRKVKSCPFCGVELEFRKREKGDIYIHPLTECIARGWYFDAHNKRCIKLWNTRKPMEKILERLETLSEKAQHNTEKASGFGKEYEKHMIVNGAKVVAYDTAIRIIKEEGAE